MTITIVDEIAQVFQVQESPEKALEWYERALAGYKKSHGPDHLMVFNTVFNMARIFHKLGQYDKALEWYERAVAGYRKLLELDHDLALLTLNPNGRSLLRAKELFQFAGMLQKSAGWLREVTWSGS